MVSKPHEQKWALIIEDDPFAQKAVAEFLASRQFDVIVATTMEEAEQILGESTPVYTLAIVDIQLRREGEDHPSSSEPLGLKIVQRIKMISPQTGVLIWTAHARDFFMDIMTVLAQGHTGIACLAKGSAARLFPEAIAKVLSGELYLSLGPQIMPIKKQQQLFLNALPPNVANAVERLVETFGRLSPRELEVAQRLSWSTEMIAANLSISEKAVRNHMDNIYTKLDLKDELIIQSLRRDTLIVLGMVLQHLRQQYSAA